MAKSKNRLVAEPGRKIEFTEEMIGELYKCKQSVQYFSNNYCYVVHPTDGKIKIDLRVYQNRIIDTVDGNRQTVILAPRQCGKTTAIQMIMLHYAMFTPYKCCAILANKDATAKSILDDIKTAYENLPDWMKVGVTEWNAHTIVFENGSKIFSAATSKDAIAGESVSFLYIDECALIPENLAREFYRANYPTVSKGEKIVITSTARGVGNLFHSIWKGAIDKTNTYVPVRVDYWEVPEYSSAEWKENMIADIGQISFNSEYGNHFIGSQTTVVAATALKNMKGIKPIREEKIMDGYLKIFEEPDKTKPYIAAVDVSTGSGNDYSVMQIFRVEWREPIEEDYALYEKKSEDVPEAVITKLVQAAIFRSNLVNIPNFVTYVFEILPMWGDPYFILENNGIGQSFADKMLEEYYWENAYYHPRKPYSWCQL
jgi:hypothetical protein